MHKLFTSVIVLAAAMLIPPAQAEYQWGFGDISINYLDWSKNTTRKTGSSTHKDDFAYLELEGGAGFNWGEIYGFFDVENPFNKRHDKPGHERRYAFKTSGRYYLGDTGFNLYGHVFGLYTAPQHNKFHEINALYGIGYNATVDAFWLKPFAALHYVDQTFYTGNNGVVVGWVAGYDFTAWGEKFSVTNWNELEFARANEYAQGNGKEGVNGAIAIWWTPIQQLTAGLQYRYAHNKLGEKFLQNGLIYSIKYNF